MPRLKKPVSFALDPKLLARLRAWIDKQDIPLSQTAVVETAIREFLERRESKR